MHTNILICLFIKAKLHRSPVLSAGTWDQNTIWQKRIILAAERSVRQVIIITTKEGKGLLILEIHSAGIKNYNQIVSSSI